MYFTKLITAAALTLASLTAALPQPVDGIAEPAILTREVEEIKRGEQLCSFPPCARDAEAEEVKRGEQLCSFPPCA